MMQFHVPDGGAHVSEESFGEVVKSFPVSVGVVVAVAKAAVVAAVVERGGLTNQFHCFQFLQFLLFFIVFQCVFRAFHCFPMQGFS